MIWGQLRGNNVSLEGTIMALPVFDTIPKEIYLLIGAVVGFAGAILGFVGAISTALISRRTQLKLAREANQQQLHLARETHQQQQRIEALKLQAQARQEAQLNLRSKMEEAHQLLSKIATENSQTASYITWDRKLSVAEYHAHYQQQQSDVQRLEMLVALYFPGLQAVLDELPGLTNLYWGYQQMLIRRDAHREEGEEPRSGADPWEEKLLDYARQIYERVSAAQDRLRTMVSEVLPPPVKE
jgi:hypothetical protein